MENKKLKTIIFFLPLFFVLILSAASTKAVITPLDESPIIKDLPTTTAPVGTIDNGYQMGADGEWHLIGAPAPTTTGTGTTTSAGTTTETETAKGAGLELVYPEIPGAVTPKYISVGIPAYVEYLFKLAVWGIGIIIFLVLLYHGFLYFTSVGNPAKFTDAIDGIKSAGLGAIILLSAYLIFNTINPQLTILNAPDLTVLAPNVTPGIYLCNYKIGGGAGEDGEDSSISAIIRRYTNTADETETDKARTDAARADRIKAAEELGALMVNKEKNKLCYRVMSTTDLNNFTYDIDGNRNTMFMIPRKEYVEDTANPGKTKVVWKYDYGIIFHEDYLRKGKCKIARKVFGESIAGSVGETGFNARSVTLFTTPPSEPRPDSKGVILYECKGYNPEDKKFCPAGIEIPAKGEFPRISMQAGQYFAKFKKDELVASVGTTRELANNTMSIQFNPTGYYFAVLFSEDDFKGYTCEVISSDDPDLTNNPIGQCGGVYAYPCLKSMIVIKGQTL